MLNEVPTEDKRADVNLPSLEERDRHQHSPKQEHKCSDSQPEDSPTRGKCFGQVVVGKGQC